MREHVILRVVCKLLIPHILLFALYVQFHGDYGPGGGFQAGVIFAAAFLLYGMVFGLERARQAAPHGAVETIFALGVLIFAGVGITTMLLGGNFLDYDLLDTHDPAHGQEYGIISVELGVLVTVFGVMVGLFYAFAGRRRIDT